MNDLISEHYKTAYDYCLKLLSIREICERDLRKKLKNKSLTKSETDQIIDTLKDKKYLSDDRYSVCFIKEHTKRKKGVNWIIHALKNKGITVRPEKIEEIRQDYALKDGKSLALEILLKKYPDFSHDLKSKSRAYRGLASRGFSFKEIDFAFDSAFKVKK